MTTTESRPGAEKPGSGPATAQTAVSEKDARQVAEAAREKEWRRPSFGKELFLGRFQLDLIEPPPGQTAAGAVDTEAEAFLARLGEFAANKIDGPAIERDALIPDEVLTGLADLGAFGMKIDKKYGGVGLSHWD
jgi:alkylation response protein AidB-like acyl-CoA dehydrogenase